MKYCPKCKKLYTDKNNHCSECKNKALVVLDEGQTPVLLCNCTASQREILMNMLAENKIPCSYESQSEPNGMAMEGFNIFVPYGSYKEASDIAVQTGSMKADEEIIENIQEFSDYKAEKEVIDDMQEMSPAKRTTVKILSAIGLIILFAAVIFGVDYVMNLIKNLFM